MKKLATAAFTVLAFAAVSTPTAYAQDTIDWGEKQFYGIFEAHGAVWDFLFGGGGSIGLEFASKDIFIGFGARSGFSGWIGEDSLDWEYTDMTWDNDIWIPIRISDSCTLYGGVGVNYHDMECEGLVESKSYYRNGRYRRYTYQLKTVTYSHGGNMDTQAWFAGARWRVKDGFFVFGEYRQTRGTIEMETSDLEYRSELRTMKVDMDKSCVLFGAGVLF